nr:tetratricopeptide repeat protein [Rhizobiaceae bacterium]
MSSDKLPQFAAFQSSGDLIADRRAGYARDLARRGDFAAAIDLMRQALELAPGHTPFLLRLAEWLERIGNRDGAVAALRDALVADPHDRHGAALKLALLGETQTPQAPPAAYVAGLFDAYAPRFDSALVERLGYRAPDLLWRALCAVSGGTSPAYRHALDLGCGTGLMGERLRRAVSFLEGVDLSAGMLREAEVKGVYDRLRHGDAFATTEAVPAHADLAV